MRRQLRVGSALSWIVACVLAVLGWAQYLLLSSDVSWVLGIVLASPLAVLIVWTSGGDGGSGSDGPWGPPDHGGL